LSLRDLAPERRPIQDLKAQIQDLDDNIEKIERQMTSTDPDQRRLLSEAMTEFEGLENERKNALLYHNKVLAASEQARIVANLDVVIEILDLRLQILDRTPLRREVAQALVELHREVDALLAQLRDDREVVLVGRLRIENAGAVAQVAILHADPRASGRERAHGE
jgi:TolA-binding protein